MKTVKSPPHVAIVGGGLAGLAAAVALCERGWRVELFEARRQLGGRAGSFRDRESGEMIDHCQHVSMGCCTNFDDLCRRTEIAHLFQHDGELSFFGRDGRHAVVRSVAWLPAPLHLAPSLLMLKHLPRRERWSITFALGRLARTAKTDVSATLSFGQWLRDQGQSQRAVDDFWSVILVSALADTVDRVSFAFGRKVFIDGFMASRQGHILRIPKVSLGEIYGRNLAEWLTNHGVTIHLSAPVRQLTVDTDRVASLNLDGEFTRRFDYFVIALPWRRVGQILAINVADRLPRLRLADEIDSSPITGVHLWFDRSITKLSHAVMVGRLSHWLFSRGLRSLGQTGEEKAYYYQVVISASRNLVGRKREDVVREVCLDIASVCPGMEQARLIHWKIVSQEEAVFVVRPGVDDLRSPQKTAWSNLALAGDWTQTGWPATMESAVRSGYLAAEVLLGDLGSTARELANDLPRGWLSKWVVKQ